MITLLSLVLLAAAPELSFCTPYARASQDTYFSGDQLASASGSSFLVYAPIDSRLTTLSIDNQAEVIHDGLDAGPNVNWGSQGTANALVRVSGFTNQLFRANLALESTETSPTAPTRAKCAVCRYSNVDGNGTNLVINKPELWAVLGAKPTRLYSGRVYSLIGRNMMSVSRLNNATSQTSAWLRRSIAITSVSNPNGSAYVVTTSGSHGLSTGDKVRLYNVTGHANVSINATFTITSTGSTTFSLQSTTGNGGATGSGGQASILYPLDTILQRGGLNTAAGMFGQISEDYFDIRIPSTVPAGSYKLCVFTNENAWGVSAPLDVTVLAGTEESWLTPGGSTRGVTTIPISYPIDIASVSNPSGNPYVVTTTAAHGFRSGNVVTLGGVAGHAGAVNGAWSIEVTGTTTFRLVGSTGSGGAAGSGGQAAKSFTSGEDITHDLTRFIASVKDIVSEDAPFYVCLPPGKFYLSHVITLPPHVGLCGAGMDATTLAIAPHLSGSSDGTFTAGTFSTNINAYDDQAGVYSGYGAAVDSGVLNGTQTVGSVACMIRLGGSNVRLKDLTIEAAADNYRRCVIHAVGAAGSVDDVELDHVRIINPQQDHTSGGTPAYPSCLYLVGSHSHWRIKRCELRANRVIAAATSPSASLASNGLNADWLIEDSDFESVNSIHNGSVAGFIGTRWLVNACRFKNLNRVFTSNGGHYSYRSVLCHNQITHTGNDEGGSEVFLWEARTQKRFAVTSASSTTVAVGGSDSASMAGKIVLIVSGKGIGQYRRVTSSSYSAPTNTMTLDAAWRVTPDTSSKILVDAIPADVSLVGNYLNATKGGILLYGGGAGVRIAANVIVSSREGVLLDTLNASAATSGAIAWTVIDGNVFDNTNALRCQAVRSSSEAVTETWPMILCTSFRKNDVEWGSQVVLGTAVGTWPSSASATATTLDAAPPIVGTSIRVNDWLTDPGRYNGMPVFARAPLLRPPIVIGRAISDLVVSENTVDGETVASQATLYRTMPGTALPAGRNLLDATKSAGGIMGP